MKFTATTAVLALAAAAPLANAYPVIKANVVNCRSGPGTNHGVVKTYKLGQDLKLTCQTPGQNVFGVSLWDKTSDGCFVSDYYVKTGTGNYVVGKCGGGSTNPPPPPPPGNSNGACTRLNQAGLNLISEFEGFVATPKPDPIGLPTVGYGHLCQQRGCAEVKYKFPLTKATAQALLNDDIPKYTVCLAKALNANKVKLNDNQFAALASWTFNVGCGGASGSRLVARLNKGENPNTVAAQELPQWNKAGGRVLAGLTRRRNAEVKLFQTASSKQAFPKCQ